MEAPTLPRLSPRDHPISAVNLQLLVGGQLEQSDDFRDGGHRDDAGGDGGSAGAEARENGSFRAK